MKRFFCVLTAAVLALAMFASCGKTVEAKWQEQLDLGMRYLEEMDYENAVLSFNKAIEIDPRQAESYLGLADVYIMMGDYETAMEVLQQGYDATGSDLLKNKLEDMRSGNIVDFRGRVLQKTVYEDGEIAYIYTYTYNEDGYEVRFDCESYKEGEQGYYGVVEEFSENGAPYRYNYYSADGSSLETWDIMTFNDQKQEIRREKHWGDEGSMVYEYSYDDQGRQSGWKCYMDGELESYCENTYDENGRLTGETIYNADGSIQSQSEFE